MLSPLHPFDAGLLGLQPDRRRVSTQLRGRLVYLDEVEAIVVVQTRLAEGWRCGVVARRNRHGPGPRVDVSDDEMAAAVFRRLPVDARTGLVAWQAVMLWQAWTYRHWHSPRMRQLCRILAEDLRRPGTVTVNLHAGAVRQVLNQLNMRPPGLAQLLRHLVAAGVLTPVSSAGEDSADTRSHQLDQVHPYPSGLQRLLEGLAVGTSDGAEPVYRLRLKLPRSLADVESVEIAPSEQPDRRRHDVSTGSRRSFVAHRSRRRLMVSASTLVLLLLSQSAVGCDRPNGTPPPQPPPEPVVIVTRTPPVEPDPITAVGDAVATYLGMWRAYQDAIKIPDPLYPELDRYAAGEALRRLWDGLVATRLDGLRGIGVLLSAPHVVEVRPAVDPREVSIRDCVDTSQTTLVAIDPSIEYVNGPGGRRLCLATVTRDGDGWKVTTLRVHPVGSC
jgi:hypothetical protein